MAHATETVSLPLVEHVFALIQAVPPAAFDAHLIEFVQRLTARGIELVGDEKDMIAMREDDDKESEEDLEHARWFGLPLLWHGLCHARFPSALLTPVMQALCASLALPACHRLRGGYIARCLECIKAHRLVGPAMQILQVLIGTRPLIDRSDA
jgi:hypothetical protein